MITNNGNRIHYRKYMYVYTCITVVNSVPRIPTSVWNVSLLWTSPLSVYTYALILGWYMLVVRWAVNSLHSFANSKLFYYRTQNKTCFTSLNYECGVTIYFWKDTNLVFLANCIEEIISVFRVSKTYIRIRRPWITAWLKPISNESDITFCIRT